MTLAIRLAVFWLALVLLSTPQAHGRYGPGSGIGSAGTPGVSDRRLVGQQQFSSTAASRDYGPRPDERPLRRQVEDSE